MLPELSRKWLRLWLTTSTMGNKGIRWQLGGENPIGFITSEEGIEEGGGGGGGGEVRRGGEGEGGKRREGEKREEREECGEERGWAKE